VKTETETEPRPSLWALLLWTVPQVLFFVFVLNATALTTLLFLAFVTLITWGVASGGVGFLVYPITLICSSLLLLSVEEVAGAQHVSNLIFWLSLLCEAVFAFVIVRKLRPKTVDVLGSEVPAIIAAFILVVRWPQRTPLDFLSLLKFEDNASWLAMAAHSINKVDEPHSDGPVAAVMRTLIGAIQRVSLGGHSSGEMSHAYNVVGLTYQTMIFLGCVLAGSAVSKLVPAGRRSVRMLISAGGASLSYALLGLPLSTGHLTFIGAMVFMWAVLYVPQHSMCNERWAGITRTVLLLGAAGMWWPLAPLLPIALCVYVLGRGRLMILARLQTSHGRFVPLSSSIFLATLLGLGTWLALRHLPLSLREFFTVKGGLQPLPPNLLILGLAGILAMITWRHVDIRTERWVETTLSLVVYSFVLVLIAQFVGPDYAANYSPSKLLLFAAIFISPFIAVIPPFALRNQPSVIVPLLCVVLAVSQSWFVGAWSLNSPRLSPVPGWGKSYLRYADDNQATVFCLTAQAERRLEAYECTRHALSLANFDLQASAALQHLVLFSGEQTPDNEVRVTSVAQAFKKEVESKGKIIALSIDPVFSVAPEDAWWYDELPSVKKRIVRP